MQPAAALFRGLRWVLIVLALTKLERFITICYRETIHRFSICLAVVVDFHSEEFPLCPVCPVSITRWRPYPFFEVAP
jgi:hypothetical protein